MTFKYHVELAKMASPCPAIDATPIKALETAYRVVKANNPTSADFVPPGIMNRGLGHNFNCASYALSFFASEQQALDQAKKLRCQHKNLGDYVVRSVLDISDGIRTSPNKRGHFDLYEFATAAIHTKSNTVCQVS